MKALLTVFLFGLTGFPVLSIVNLFLAILALLLAGGIIFVLLKRRKAAEMYVKREKQIQAFPPGHRR